MGDAGQVSTFAVLDGGDINVFFMLCFATLLAWSNGANDIANCTSRTKLTRARCRRAAAAQPPR